LITLPDSAEAFKDATWDDVQPYYEELESRTLDRANVESWLADWSLFESLLGEASALAYFAYTTNTADPKLEEAELRFSTEIAPKARERRTRLQARLVELGYLRQGLETIVRRFENQMRLFKEVNVPLFAQLARLSTDWSKVIGAMTVEWDGEEKTPQQMLPYLEDNDRSVRERAFRNQFKPYMDQRDTLAGLFDQMYDLRQAVARNAGFANYRDYAHREKNRFDYTPDDCLRFHEAVEESVTPAVQRIMERRRSELNLDRLRPWDLAVDPHGRAALKPFADIKTFVGRGPEVFAHVDPDFGGYFERMADAKLLDLDNRKGKAPGGYCTTLPFRKMPMIFMNAVGIDDDLRTLRHEAGHAFHSFEAARLPLIFQRHPGSEMAEVASMSMELLTLPYIDVEHGGYYSQADARRSARFLFEDIVIFFTHCASVDAFQQWIYTDPDGRDAEARDRKWLKLRRRFEGNAVDWTGEERLRVARWYYQPHIFDAPFYYIEYGIAQLGALQVWRNSIRDSKAAVRGYREALALGATRPLPELFAAAGARLVFDAAGMKDLISTAEERLAALD
jgi:oligoendopeptidase F